MENSPYGYSSNEVSGDESFSNYDQDLTIVESVSKADPTSDIPYDFTLSKSSHDSLGLSSFGVINSTSAKEIMENNEYPAQKRLMLWHSLCSREYLDVFSSLGVCDTNCLIHSESLIVYICCLAHKEGQNLLDFSSGPQTLQFIYRVDRFLSSFSKCGGTVKLVFFDIFKKVFDPRFSLSEDDDPFFDGYLYYRQLLLCYFKQRRLPYLVFDNWLTDTRFLKYLSDNEPTCILLEDGSSFVYVFDTVYELLEMPCKGKVNSDNLEKYSEYLSNQNKVDRYCNVVYTLISQSLSNSLSVAYFFDISRHSQDFKAFISFSSSTHVPMALHNQSSTLLVQQYGLNESIKDSNEKKENKDLLYSLYKEYEKLVDSNFSLRDLMVCNYLKEYAKSNTSSGSEGLSDEELEALNSQNQLFLLTFKCLLVHNYLMENVSLRDRCTKRVNVSGWSFYTEMVTATVDFMCVCSYPVLDSLFLLDDEDLKHLSRLDTEVKDLFDSNLFTTVLYLLCEYASNHDDEVDEAFVPLDKEVLKKFDRLYQHFTKDSSVTFFPVQLNHLEYKYPHSELVYTTARSSEYHSCRVSENGTVDESLVDGPNESGKDHKGQNDTRTNTNSTTTTTVDNENKDSVSLVKLDYNYLDEIKNKYLFVNNSFVNLYYKFDRKDLQWVRAKPVDELVMLTKYFWRDPCTVSERMECIDFHLNLDAKEKHQELTKFAMRRSLQHQSSFSFQLSKYLGSSNLHHPIVIKLEHYWLHIKYLNLLGYSKTISSGNAAPASSREPTKPTKSGKNVQKSSKEGKSSTKDKLSKVELLRLKNSELQETKRLDSDNNTMNRLEIKLLQLFNNDKSFSEMYNNILEYTDGPNRAVDLLTDFKWVKSILSTRNVQVVYLYKMLQQLYNCFCSYRLRIVKSAPNSFRRLLTMVLRLIFVYYNQYYQLMTRDVVLLLYTFLHQLNFTNYSHNLVNSYNNYLTSKESEGSKDKSKADREKGEKKGGKKGGGKQVREDKKEEVDMKNLISPKDLEKVNRECEVWDFAIFDNTEYNFMLCYMGDLFERTLGSTNDPRVLFRPDAWQKMLLDIVDARESALVVAPTSTGKTYICYYAMEQVLRLDDNGMVIYVAPNTALALQVTYEIIARFSSKYYTNPNLALNSTFLEKFHDPKWNTSQIVVTVPTILEKLLISMRTNESNFVSRLEYIIFDEVHCIADVDLGTFMERCIHLIPCPFLALSATIGNASQFYNWLTKVTNYNNPVVNNLEGDDQFVFNNNKVHFIQFDERFSDLKLEIYSSHTQSSQNSQNTQNVQNPQNTDPSNTSTATRPAKDKNKLLAFNPVCCMTYNNLFTNGFPNDVYLTPYDCYLLVQSLFLSAYSNSTGAYQIGQGSVDQDPGSEETDNISNRFNKFHLNEFHLNNFNNVNNSNQVVVDDSKTSELLANIEYLDPNNYFKGCTLITKRQYRYYLDTLKVEFSRQIQQGNIDANTYQQVLTNISLLTTGFSASELDNKYKLYPLLQPHYLLNHIHTTKLDPNPEHPSDSQESKESGPKEKSPTNRGRGEDVFNLLNKEVDNLEYLNDMSFYEMLKRLQSSKRLPCLVFILDRNKMDHVLMGVTKLLMRLQWEKFFGTPERTLATKMANKARMDKYHMLLKQYESEKKIRMTATKEQRELEGITSNIELEVPVEPIDISQEYDPEFYFYNRKTYVNYTDEIEKFINVAANSISNRKNSDLFIEALKRGIGIHHEGLPHKFTMLTETLLRLGFLNVIISSKSLAFGINVPCKSVLFCGDNYELTPLMFKQMSGRCGRRGFDLSGHVIFWSIPKKRIKQLLLTRLPTLTTNVNNVNLSILLTILSSFYTLIIKSNTQSGLTNLSFLNKKSDDYLDIRDDLIANSRKLLVEPKLLVQRMSSILNNTLNLYTSKSSTDVTSSYLDSNFCYLPTSNSNFGTSSNLNLNVNSNLNSTVNQNSSSNLNKTNVDTNLNLGGEGVAYSKEKIVLLVRIMLEILVNCGLLDENGLIRGCYELALLTRDIHPANVLLSRLVQTSTLTQLLEKDSALNSSKNDKEEEGVDVSLQLLELLCLLIYRKKEMGNVLNIRRLVSTKTRNGTNNTKVKNTFESDSEEMYQVAYPDTFPLLPYNDTLQKHVHYYNELVLTTTEKYLRAYATSQSKSNKSDQNSEKQGLKHPETDNQMNTNHTNSYDRSDGNRNSDKLRGGLFDLYYGMNMYKNKEGESSLGKESKDANSKQNLNTNNRDRDNWDVSDNVYLNLGGVVKKLSTCHQLELNTSCLELTSDLVPTIEGNFCTIIQLDNKFNQVKKFTTSFDNSYMCDYFTHGRFSVLRDANGLGQYAWSYLKRFIVFLQHFKYVLKTYTAHLNTDDLLYKNLRHLLDKIEPMFNKI